MVECRVPFCLEMVEIGRLGFVALREERIAKFVLIFLYKITRLWLTGRVLTINYFELTFSLDDKVLMVLNKQL